MTQLHQGLPPQDRSMRVWPMKPIRPPTFETEFLGRKFLYARKFDGMFHREDGGIANIAYVMEKVYNK